MVDIKMWLESYLNKLNETFGCRVWFVGLQGSYARGEATESSDIDMVLILDELNSSDIASYNEMLDALPYRELTCGFLSGKDELLNWEPSDLFQFYHDTKPIIGTLDVILPLIDDSAIERAIKIGACNVYHGCVHNMLYEKSEDVLKGLYKSASFVIQALYYKKSGTYVVHMRDLSSLVDSNDKAVIDTFISLKNGGAIYFNEMSDIIFSWSQSLISQEE